MVVIMKWWALGSKLRIPYIICDLTLINPWIFFLIFQIITEKIAQYPPKMYFELFSREVSFKWKEPQTFIEHAQVANPILIYWPYKTILALYLKYLFFRVLTYFSTVFYRHLYCCFIDNRNGLRNPAICSQWENNLGKQPWLNLISLKVQAGVFVHLHTWLWLLIFTSNH